MVTDKLISFIRDTYGTSDFIPLHAPRFLGNEKQYILDALDSTFVSSVGRYVDDFEARVERYTRCEKAIAVVNGTAGLHTALTVCGIGRGDLVVTQPLTFVATCNAIHNVGAEPIFIDVSTQSLGLCPKALSAYMDEHAFVDDSFQCRHKQTGQAIKAVIPMHTFGHPVELDELKEVCEKWSLQLIEDAAESLGSFYKGKHTGTVGRFGVISFNGNKIITTGGGGMVLSRSEADGNRLRHITTTAKVQHPYEYMHDEVGFNYRLPNLNSALGCAQMEVLQQYVISKRKLADRYKQFFDDSEYRFVMEPNYARSNYWLNAVLCKDVKARDELLHVTNKNGVMTRPVWKLMHRLPMYKNCMRGELSFSEALEEKLVNIPSSPL